MDWPHLYHCGLTGNEIHSRDPKHFAHVSLAKALKIIVHPKKKEFQAYHSKPM